MQKRDEETVYVPCSICQTRRPVERVRLRDGTRIWLCAEHVGVELDIVRRETLEVA